MRASGVVVGIGLGVALLAAGEARAQPRFQTLGPSECLNCHDHQDEREWYEKLEIPEAKKRFPQKGANAGHVNSLKQLETTKSDDYARAIGLKDKYDVKGSCVKCHATVFAGDANAGVSCESCHGPGSGYMKPHQTKGAYAQSIPLGMIDIVGKVPAWAQQCTTCHVMDDQRLITAGHSSGDDFDLGSMVGPVSLHFAKKYSDADVRGISANIVRSIVARRRGGPPPSPVSAAAPPPVAVAQPPTPQARPAAPVAGLPTPVQPPPAVTPAPGTIAARGRAAATPADAGRGSTAPPPAMVPVPQAVPAAAPVVAVALPPAPGMSEALPASVSAAVALVQGRLLAVLAGLVQNGATIPQRSSTPSPALVPYNGPDAALLQLQRDAAALALDVLSTPPPPPQAEPARP